MSRSQRLRLASFGALSLHAILFLSGWFVINWISVPASENRVMVLSLESTPQDGLEQQDSQPEETITDARQGEAESMAMDQPHRAPPEVSQLSSAPHPKATFDITPEPIDDVLPDQESVSHQVTSESSPKQVILEKTPSERETVENQDSKLSQQVDQRVDAIQRTEPSHDTTVSLYTAKQGLVVAPNVDPQLPLENDNPQITAVQQSMIERKIQQWAPNLANVEQVDSTFSWQHKGQTYVAKLTHVPADSDMDLDELLVEVTTIQNGQALSTAMRMKKLAFSNFAQFVHRWDPRVMIHDDQMVGRFHSNSEILLTSDRRVRPVFHGKVTTASYRVGFENTVRRNTKKEIFRGGLETGVKRINMPKPQMLFAESEGLEAEDTLTFEADTRIEFTAEGGFLWQPIGAEGTPHYEALPNYPVYLVAEKGVTLSISGQVNGKVMVYSPRRIIIEDDLTYTHADQDSDDVIGIVSGRDVVIAGQKSTGEGDLTVHGSIFARGRFHVRDYSKRHTGTLHILGSVSAGTISATQPRYATNIKFDQRFERLRPPGFPVTDRYEITMVEPSWSTIEMGAN